MWPFIISSRHKPPENALVEYQNLRWTPSIRTTLIWNKTCKLKEIKRKKKTNTTFQITNQSPKLQIHLRSKTEHNTISKFIFFVETHRWCHRWVWCSLSLEEGPRQSHRRSSLQRLPPRSLSPPVAFLFLCFLLDLEGELEEKDWRKHQGSKNWMSWNRITFP